jgi:starch synthase
MRVLLCASECVPFAKTGGLADVVSALGKILPKNKVETCVILPKYKVIDERKFRLKKIINEIIIPIGDRYEKASIWQGKLQKETIVYFIDAGKYFAREYLYRSPEGDYPDNNERFIFFSRACLEATKAVNFQPDIIHCHDWETALIPAYLKTLYRIDAFFHKTRTVLTIHNIAYQGLYPKDTMWLAGFSWIDFTPDKLEYYDMINFLKAGIVYADVITTVSPTYAQEVQSSNEFGRGMEGVLSARKDDFYGILNGIDYDEWSPEKDKYIPARFSSKNVSNKYVCKDKLCEAVGFQPDSSIPLIGMVTRLDPQKGLELIAQSIHSILNMNLRLIILGVGDKIYQDALSLIAQEYPQKMKVRLEFNNPLAHMIYAGSDMLLIPSRFEPCGLTQMIAMAYGTIPIATKTGGLADTVADFSPENPSGNGIVIQEYSSTALISAIERAIKYYMDKNLWKILMNNAFKKKFTWDRSVKEYIKIYKIALKK